MRFKVLRGSYQAKAVMQEDGTIAHPVVYPQGSVVEVDVDLAKRFNTAAHKKFKLVPKDTPLVTTTKEEATRATESEKIQDAFTGMSKVELIEAANDAEIDLGGAKTKAQILEVLRQHEPVQEY